MVAGSHGDHRVSELDQQTCEAGKWKSKKYLVAGLQNVSSATVTALCVKVGCEVTDTALPVPTTRAAYLGQLRVCSGLAMDT